MVKLTKSDQLWGIILIIVGAAFLAMNFEWIPHIGNWDWDLIWPGFVILAGIYFILGKPKLDQ